MINRALTRLKTVQILYSHYQNENQKVLTSVNNLRDSLDMSYELYQHMLALLVDIRHYAERRAESTEARAQRLNIAEEGPSTDRILADNKLLCMLSENKALMKFIDGRRILWDTKSAFMKRMTDMFVQSDIFNIYALKGDFSFEADREVVRALYRHLLCENEDMDNLLEENSIYWNDDKETIDSFVLKTIKRMTAEDTPDTPLLAAYEEGEDPEFGITLLEAAIKRGDELRDMISSQVRGWDFNRVALMDVIIMQQALAEMLTFPEIPLNVTLNEYINIAKCYSTPKSGNYVNGVLDNIAKNLKAEGKILK